MVIRNDVSVRQLEGLAIEETKVLEPIHGLDLSNVALLARGGIELKTDLINGQKTGFFLDQSENITLMEKRFYSSFESQKSKLKVLDLFSYVGQWSSYLSYFFKDQKIDATLVDASFRALEFAKQNVEKNGGTARTVKADILRGIPEIQGQKFDVVICDPPALIQGRKHIPQGKHAYLQANTLALEYLAPGGLFVSCSCSALFPESEFLETLKKAEQRTHKNIQWVFRGSQAPDHPIVSGFPEGTYLKTYFGFSS